MNRNVSSFEFNKQIKQSFESFENVSSVTSLWDWIANEFLFTCFYSKVNTSVYNVSKRQTFTQSNLLSNDSSLVLIGYPILRQLRVRKGIILFLKFFL